MATMGLPGTDLRQLRRQAKDWLRRGRAGDPEALALLRRLHPRGEELAGDPSRLQLADAQLTLARAYDFGSWTRLREHLRLVEPWRRNPHRLGEQADHGAELLRLACLTYGADSRVRPARAAVLVENDPGLAGADVFTAAATGSVSDLRRFLARDPAVATAEGGPHRWPPLLYLCFSRIPDALPERSSLDAARLLLQAGADPNAGFLWEGLAPPFTALTGAFGGGEDRAHQPPHPHATALARLLLEAGADANDGQTLYNRMFEASDDHLRLLFTFGLGRGTGGPWRARLGEAQQSPAEMLADQLVWAVAQGRTDRVALLLENGVDPNVPGSGHPTHEDRTAYEWAVHTGSLDIAALLAAAGARPPRSATDAVDRFLAAALGEDAEQVRRTDAGVRTAAIERRPGAVEQAVELRRTGAVRLLVEAGFSVHGAGRTTPLHLAAYNGDLELVRVLVDLGADPRREDSQYRSTPLGWAEHAGADEVAAYLWSVMSP
ncbi:MAG TPA: ankyrin repeat domain-containing protein [Propionibacteriaceae bacterium]|jgi:ankyrin repeat protein|nr:ankyrin repeat domain-containing protein [Propionibacteriaceae bacterium]